MKEPYSAGAAAVGLRLRQQRLKRGWSQEGLCRDICAASYLSKIEQGQVQAAPELLELLLLVLLLVRQLLLRPLQRLLHMLFHLQ